jgi:hypothetical protein
VRRSGILRPWLPVQMSNSQPRHCEERSDEAIHRAASGWMDCFASLAMTSENVPAALTRPDDACNVVPRNKREQGMPGAGRTRSLVC